MIESEATRIAKGSAYIAIQGVVTILMGATTMAFTARILTQTEMGVTVALTLVLGLAQIFSDIGFNRGLAKHIAEYRGKGTDYSVILFTGVMAKVSLAVFIGVLYVLTASQLSGVLLKTTTYGLLFQVVSINVILGCVNVTTDSFLLGLSKISEIAALNMARAVVRYLSTIALLLLGCGLLGLVAGWIFGDLAYAIPSIIITFKGRQFKIPSSQETVSYLKVLARFSWPLLLTNLLVFLYNWIDRTVLLAYLPLAEVAVYNVAFTAFGVFSFIPTALGTTLFPYFTEQFGKEKPEKITVGVQAASRYIALVFTPLALGLAITANPTIMLFAGPTYASGDVVLLILSLCAAVSSLGPAFGGLLLVYNMTPMILVINVVSVGVSLVMSLLLLPFLGVIGIALVRGSTTILLFFLTFLAVSRRVKIKLDKEAIWKSWAAATVMFAAIAAIEQVNSHRYLLPLFVLVGGIMYAIALRLLKAISEEDIELIRKLLGNRADFLVETLRRILT